MIFVAALVIMMVTTIVIVACYRTTIISMELNDSQRKNKDT